MVLKINILAFFLVVTVFANGQNPAYYKTHSQNSAVKWYFQVNVDPVIIKNGTVTSEVSRPNWYNAFQFINCPGIFNNVTEAYEHLTENTLFFDSDYTYENRNHQDATYRINSYKEKLLRSKAYNDFQAKEANDASSLSGCREQVVFSELYLKLNGYEILYLDAMPMYFHGLDSSSSVDIQGVINKITGVITDDTYNNMTSGGYYLKDNGLWKAVNSEMMGKYLQPILSVLEFKDNGKAKVHVESTVDNASGNRVYLEK